MGCDKHEGFTYSATHCPVCANIEIARLKERIAYLEKGMNSCIDRLRALGVDIDGVADTLIATLREEE